MRIQQGLPSLARIRAVATAQEPRLEQSIEGTMGEGLTAVIEHVCAALRRPQERIDDLYCDINDERSRTTDLAFTLLRMGDVFRENLNYITPVPSVGDLGAASAPFNCILAARAFARAYARGPRALVTGASWSGLRGAALIEAGGP